MDRISVIIPGRCEQYFQNTIDSILENATGDIEVIPVIDGYKPDPSLKIEDERVKPIFLNESIGQRGAYNLGVKESTGKYVMKLDAHALPSPGFDEILKSHCPSKTIVLPEMRRLDVGKWKHKPRGKTHFMYFGLDLYCHFWSSYRKREGVQTEYPEVMTGQGSCWFTTREWNDYIGLLDESVGSWGNVGIEISLRTWLCGGSQIVNKNAWQAHWFRKDDGGFTYPMNGRQVARAHNYTWNNYYFKDDAFKKQSRPFKWLIEKFAPVPSWETYLTDEYKSPRVIVYYTDSKLEEKLAKQVRKRLKKIAGPIPIISVSQKPLNFGKNICVGEKPYTYQSLYGQILTGVEAAPPESIIYLCEHDVFYHPSHFAYIPRRKNAIAFNRNRYYWKLGMESFFPARGKKALSQSVTYREYLIKHCKSRINKWEAGIKHKMKVHSNSFISERPNVDIRHGKNFTPDGSYKKAYMNGKKTGVKNLPGWGRPKHFQSITGYKEDDEALQKSDQITLDQLQHTRKLMGHYGSKVFSVQELCDNRADYHGKGKPEHLTEFLDSFPPLIRAVANGEIFDNAKISALPYARYLEKRLHPSCRIPEITNKGKNHVIKKVKDAIALFYDIKDFGLKAPLEMVYNEEKQLALYRGGRRLVILNVLGHKTVPVRTFRNREVFLKYSASPSWSNGFSGESIHDLAARQFALLKEKATDKYWVHNYTPLYDRHIGHLRNKKPCKILELGVDRGASLLLWKVAFPNAEIYGVDKNTAVWQTFLGDQDRIKIFIGRQEDDEFMKQVISGGPYDIIIDDACHRPQTQQRMFDMLWPVTSEVYVIEDLRSGSYLKKWKRPKGVSRTTDMLKGLVDTIHQKDEIRSMTHYYNICFLEKL